MGSTSQFTHAAASCARCRLLHHACVHPPSSSFCVDLFAHVCVCSISFCMRYRGTLSYSVVEESPAAEGVMGERKGFSRDIKRACEIQTTGTQISCQSEDCLAKHHSVIAIAYW